MYFPASKPFLYKSNREISLDILPFPYANHFWHLLSTSSLTEKKGQMFYAFPLSKNWGCKAGYVRSSIEVYEMKKAENQETLIFRMFRDIH